MIQTYIPPATTQHPILPCAYSVRLSSKVWQCMTEQEYQSYQSSHLTNHQAVMVLLLCLAVVLLSLWKFLRSLLI